MNAKMTRRRPAARRVTVNLPAALLAQARRASGKGLTGTLVAALELVSRPPAAASARALRGKLQIDLDLEASRERPRR
jgi:hypothetical protein